MKLIEMSAPLYLLIVTIVCGISLTSGQLVSELFPDWIVTSLQPPNLGRISTIPTNVYFTGINVYMVISDTQDIFL